MTDYQEHPRGRPSTRFELEDPGSVFRHCRCLKKSALIARRSDGFPHSRSPGYPFLNTPMALFDRFLKQEDESAAALPPRQPLPSICYDIAYYILPHYAFRDGDKLVAMFEDTPESTGPFFYLMGCQTEKIEPVEEDARRFRVQHGALDDVRDYFLIEYPEPPPMDLTGVDVTRLPPGAMPVLAPFFSVVIRDRVTRVVRYFVLGQAPLGGTTLRSVSADGRNANLGHGPEPDLQAFLDALRSRE
jgi:hypothetical protein